MLTVLISPLLLKIWDEVSLSSLLSKYQMLADTAALSEMALCMPRSVFGGDTTKLPNKQPRPWE